MPLADELEDRKPKRQQGWNQVPQAVRDGVLELALERTDLSPRQLACSFTDERGYFLSESTVYRILKAHDLIVSPARFAAMLVGNGFELAGVDRFGVGHRFTKGRVTIDGLGPDGLSTRRGALTTIPPARTV